MRILRRIYAPPGYLLFVRQGVLLAQAFDAAKRQQTGDPVRLADSVNFDLNGATAFSTSDNGVLSYRTGIDASDFCSSPGLTAAESCSKRSEYQALIAASICLLMRSGSPFIGTTAMAATSG